MPAALVSLLEEETRRISAELTPEDRYRVAVGRWNNRRSRAPVAWRQADAALSEGLPRSGRCCYCEYNGAQTIDHFFPKRYFPEKAFQWENFVPACSSCNTYKGDQFEVFESKERLVFIALSKHSPAIAGNEDAVLINPRADDPYNFLKLELSTGIYQPLDDLSDRDKVRANRTIELLRFNIDDNIVRWRRRAFSSYMRKLDDYVKVKGAENYEEMREVTPPDMREAILSIHSFEEGKEWVLRRIEADICDDAFPSVWEEMKKQRRHRTELSDLFEAAPEALSWI